MTKTVALTPQQQAILQTLDVSVGVSAGAGCGKTFVLTERFLTFLRQRLHLPEPLAGIVAITFTEKAAREMRHRVRVACNSELRNCGDDEVAAWSNVVRGLDGARISTIHSFCTQMLRANAVELGIDPRFAVAEGRLGTDAMLQPVQDLLRSRIVADDSDARLLVTRLGWDRTRELLSELAVGVRGIDPDDPPPSDPADLVARWETAWFGELLPEMVARFRAHPKVQRIAASLRDAVVVSEKASLKRAEVLEFLGRPAPADSLTWLDSLREAAMVKGLNAKHFGDQQTYESIRDGFKDLRDEIDIVMANQPGEPADMLAAAEVAAAGGRLAAITADRLDLFKRQQAALRFDDLLVMCRDLLRDHPAVLRRASEGIDLLMVDEFQDTDPVQADIVRLLCGERLTTGKLFLVGDAKQSIYRFRKADPHVFAALRGELDERGRLPLNVNFRSQPAILNFVNCLFATEMPDYESLQPAVEQRSPEPAIEFLFLPPVEHERADARRVREAQQVARRIAELLNDPTPRIRDPDGSLRRVRPGDICLLSRTWNTQPFEQALTAHEIDYYIAGGKAFFAQQEVQDFAFLCRWLDEPDDELALTGLLRSPFFGINDDSLYALAAHGSGMKRLWRGLQAVISGNIGALETQQRDLAGRACSVLSELREKKDRLSLSQVLQLAIELTGYDAALLCEHLGSRKLANLRKLLRLAHAFDADAPLGMTDFARGLRDAIAAESDEKLAPTHPESGDVVQFTTIFQSKGLEYPVVFLVNMQWSDSATHREAGKMHPRLGPIFSIPKDPVQTFDHLGRRIDKLLEDREEEAECNRLLYVALTRARDHLVLCAGLPEKVDQRSPWLRLIGRHINFETGLPHGDPYFGSVTRPATSPTELPSILVHHDETKGTTPAARHDRSPLRNFREATELARNAPLPPLVLPQKANSAGRDEFTVTEIVEYVYGATKEFEWDHPRRPADINNTTNVHSLLGLARTEERGGRLAGILTHLLLERFDLTDRSQENILQTVDRTLLLARGRIDSELKRTLTNRLKTFAESQLCTQIAKSRRVHREVDCRLMWPMAGGEPKCCIIGTIDLMHQTADGCWHLVDYKTTSVSATNTELRRRYELQLRIYAIAMRQLFRSAPESATLLRLGAATNEIEVSVSNEDLSAAAAAIDNAVNGLRSLNCVGSL